MISIACSKDSTGVRPFNPARDLGQLADLIENAFGQELSHGGEKILREIRLLGKLGPLNHLLSSPTMGLGGMFTGFVWEHGGRVVGNVSVNRAGGRTYRWQISNVAVLDTFRQQGIGQQLMQAALDLIAEQRGRTAYLFVRDDNVPALRLYERFGFTEVDRRSEFELGPIARGQREERRLLVKLEPSQQQALFDLVRRAEGPGHHWLSKIQRRTYVLSADERLLNRIESFVSGRVKTRWVVPGEWELRAGVILAATHWWNRASHRLRLWVHPNSRGQIEADLVHDTMALLARYPGRSTSISLAACEERAMAALQSVGFSRIRTLILMKVDI